MQRRVAIRVASPGGSSGIQRFAQGLEIARRCRLEERVVRRRGGCGSARHSRGRRADWVGSRPPQRRVHPTIAQQRGEARAKRSRWSHLRAAHGRHIAPEEVQRFDPTGPGPPLSVRLFLRRRRRQRITIIQLLAVHLLFRILRVRRLGHGARGNSRKGSHPTQGCCQRTTRRRPGGQRSRGDTKRSSRRAKRVEQPVPEFRRRLRRNGLARGKRAE
mmetsp:Transcript_5243/g.17405  ORF Transcript_5243/g.17405 Transcript_5243/m.17405 type:complete len:217 (+) Transcript_5243:804-1454(+)